MTKGAEREDAEREDAGRDDAEAGKAPTTDEAPLIQDLVVAVTGGASGIGAAVVDAFIAHGARVAVLDRDLPAAIDTTADTSSGGDVGAGTATLRRLDLHCDVGEQSEVDAAIAATVNRWARLDIVVNNAGIGAVGDVTAQDDQDWARVFDVNVTAIVRTSRAALPHLRRSPAGAIINICSAVAHIGVRQRALYSASKGAVHALTLAMAADHVAEGIRVNAVSPGTAATAWVERLLENADDPERAALALRARQPIGRLVSPHEVAAAVVFLASPVSAATTGAVLNVDGGMTALRL